MNSLNNLVISDTYTVQVLKNNLNNLNNLVISISYGCGPMDFESLESLQAKGVGANAAPLPHQKQLDIGQDLYRKALSILASSFSEMIEAFDCLPSSNLWKHRSVKDFMASDEIARLEAAVNGQCAIVRAGATIQERKAAFARVEEGMEYYRRAVFFRIRGRGKA
jgi:hypothetical protein